MRFKFWSLMYRLVGKLHRWVEDRRFLAGWDRPPMTKEQVDTFMKMLD